MWINKNGRNDIFLFLIKTSCLILGLNIFLTSVLTTINFEFKKTNFESGMNLKIKDQVI